MKYIRTKDGRIINSEKGRMDRLNEREKHVLEVISEHEGRLNEAYIALAKEYGVTQERIRQIHVYHAQRKIELGRDWLEGNVLKEADTIEELCDEFVGVLENGEGSHVWYDEPEDEYYFQGAFERIKSHKDEYEIIYGAIWTDKGLIYVAKTNEEGELKLL